MDMIVSVPRIARVFGPNSTGDTLEERAKTSTVVFVRSQDHLAIYSAGATGHRLTAWEAFSAFGFERLEQVVDYGSAILVSDLREPAATLRHRREILELEPREIAKSAGVKVTQVQDAENPNKRNSIGILERIASCLGLDESRLGTRLTGDDSENLALRLRQMKHGRPDFAPPTVLKFAEAAWVTQKQALLAEWVGVQADFRKLGFEPDSRYGDRSYPAWRCGYDLAHTARKLLGFREHEPIPLRDLVEERLEIPLVHLALPTSIAGATISAGGVRGIAVNSSGSNANVWIRRATIAHELGHLLWDPEQRLNSLTVDMFRDFEEPPQSNRDHVEARANAFAIEFLAPQEPALEVYQRHAQSSDGLRDVMVRFGVSFTSAKFQIWNALNRSVPLDSFAVSNVEPTDDWKGKESFTIDYFKPASVRDSRRGRFASFVIRAMSKKLISESSAALFLGCGEQELEEGTKFIEGIYGLEDQGRQ